MLWLLSSSFWSRGGRKSKQNGFLLAAGLRRCLHFLLCWHCTLVVAFRRMQSIAMYHALKSSSHSFELSFHGKRKREEKSRHAPGNVRFPPPCCCQSERHVKFNHHLGKWRKAEVHFLHLKNTSLFPFPKSLKRPFKKHWRSNHF